MPPSLFKPIRHLYAVAGTVFLAAVLFFATVLFLAAWAFSALTLAHLAFVAAIMRAIPAFEMRRLGFAGGAAAWVGSDSPRILAHRRCWASFMRLRVAAENFLRLRGAASDVVPVDPLWSPPNI